MAKPLSAISSFFDRDRKIAEPMILPIAKSVVRNISSSKEINAPNSVNTALEKIAENLTAIFSILEDAEIAEFKRYSINSIRDWLGDLKRVIYDIDDLLDEMAFDALRDGYLRRELNHKLQSLHVELASIVDKKYGFGFTMIPNLPPPKRINPNDLPQPKKMKLNLSEYSSVDIRGPSETSSYVRVPDVFGRDEVMNDILTRMKAVNDVTEVSVLSIVGKGGIGKTALAKLVYRDVQHFDIKCWLNVPYKIHISKIIDETWSDGTPNEDTSMLEWEKLHLIYGKKYLLVLDDVSEEDPDMWLQLKQVLEYGGSGSVILITTRNDKVAVASGTIESYHLDGLPNDVCWSIFKQLAFKEGEEGLYPHLCHIGKSIAEKCLGFPLLIKILASLLRSQRATHKWLEISEMDIYFKDTDISFEKYDIPITAAWRVFDLNYCELKSHLKPCFASLLLSKYRDLSTDHVSYVWSALGLLPTEDKNKDIEELGYSYFMELVSKSLVENPSIYFDGIYLKCEMYEYLLQRAAGCMGKALAVVSSDDVNSGKIGDLTRHIVWEVRSGDNLKYIKFQKEPAIKARTLRFDLEMNKHVSQTFLESIISTFSYLRILVFGNLWFDQLPRSIGELKHLRFLDVSYNPRIRCLPNTICNLLNLETFCIHGCENLKELPKHIHQLPSLKKFRVTTCQRSLIGSRFSDLSSLQFLSFDSCKKMKSMWDNDNVGNLTSLRTLCINDCPKLRNLPNSMKFLVSLQKLHIQNCKKLELCKGEGLQGLQSLRYLFINNVKLSTLPDDVTSAAISLQHLIIRDCSNLMVLPDWLDKFTSLLTIEIINCPGLLGLPNSFNALTSLQKLIIKGCPHVLKRCAVPGGEDYSLIKHIPIFEHDSIDFIQNQATSSNIERPLTILDYFLKGKEVLSDSSLQTKDPVIDDGSYGSDGSDGSDESVSSGVRWFSGGDDGVKSGEDVVEETSGEDVGVISREDVVEEKSGEDVGVISREDVVEEISGEDVGVISREDVGVISREDVVGMISAEDGSSFEVSEKYMIYCLLFGENYEFEKEKIIQLWMAARFLTEEPLENNGDHIFNILLKKKYILPSRIGISRQSNLYKVNSDMRSVVCARADSIKEFNLIIGDDDIIAANQFTDLWHISVQSSNINHSFESLKKIDKVKTLLLLNESLLTRVPPDFFSTYKLLTALDLSGSRITELPSSIQDAKELCYVDLSGSLINRLPQSIVHLQKLQTLRLKGCTNLYELPERMMELINLRHLDFDVLSQLTLMPRGIGHLTELRTLHAFIVDGEIVEGVKRCNIKELKLMNNLSGTLCISGLEHASSQDAEEATLIDKKHLKHLELRWRDFSEYFPKEELVRVIQGLKPHPSLEELKIVCYPGECLPDWIGDPQLNWIGDPQYERLVSITLFKCENCSNFPCLGRLPQLRNLEIFEMNGVEIIDHTCYGEEKDRVAYHALEKLSINGMYHVEEWKGLRDGDFPCLVKLVINRCPNLALLSSFPRCQSLKHLELIDCPQLKCLPDDMLSSSLDNLVIDDCPLLRQLYSNGGQDSHKIEHVIEVWIESEETESSDEHSISTEDDDSIDGMHHEDYMDILKMPE